MDRHEHLAWCKKRALELVDLGDTNQALTSMMSDLEEHPDTASHAGITLTAVMMMAGQLGTPEKARKHIQGFN